MPKKQFDSPTLPDIIYKYIGMMQKPSRQSDFEKLENTFQKVLRRTNNPKEIRKALELDTRRRLPVQIKSPAYERILVLEGRSAKLLREYAQDMYEYGPEFAHYADMLWDEADELDEIQSA